MKKNRAGHIFLFFCVLSKVIIENGFAYDTKKIEKSVENYLFQLRENKKLWGINFSIYKDRHNLIHYRIGVFDEKKSFEKDSINKAEYDYFKGFGIKLIERMKPDTNSTACSAPIEYIVNYSNKNCFFPNGETKNEFMDWFQSSEKFVLGKEERDNNLLKRFLKSKDQN